MVLTSGREGTFPPRMGLCGERAEQARLKVRRRLPWFRQRLAPHTLDPKPAEQPPRWMPCPFGACGDGHSSVACPVIGPFLKTGPAALRAVFTECRTNGRPFGAYRDCRAEEAFAYLWGFTGRSCRWRRCCWKIIDSLGATVFALRLTAPLEAVRKRIGKRLLMKRILMLGLLALSLLCGTAFAKTGEHDDLV